MSGDETIENDAIVPLSPECGGEINRSSFRRPGSMLGQHCMNNQRTTSP